MPETKKKILIVDDDPRLRALVRMSLGDRFLLIEAQDGPQALAFARTRRPDLILLDVTMPGMNGIDVCEKLKADPATSDLSVVMLTARNSPEEVSRAIELGAVDYITKPFSPRHLLDRIVELLS